MEQKRENAPCSSCGSVYAHIQTTHSGKTTYIHTHKGRKLLFSSLCATCCVVVLARYSSLFGLVIWIFILCDKKDDGKSEKIMSYQVYFFASSTFSRCVCVYNVEIEMLNSIRLYTCFASRIGVWRTDDWWNDETEPTGGGWLLVCSDRVHEKRIRITAGPARLAFVLIAGTKRSMQLCQVTFVLNHIVV